MFLKQQIFKALLKRAWEGSGLTVVNMGEQWYICGYSWMALIDKKVMPNKALAAIIELTGEMPGNNEGFTAGKNVPNQYELKEATVIDLMKKLGDANVEMVPTVVMVERDYKTCRLIQHPDTGRIKYINDIFVQLISISEIDRERETAPSGPLWNPQDPYLMLWTNGYCVFGAYTLRDPDEGSEDAQIFERLAVLPLPEKR